MGEVIDLNPANSPDVVLKAALGVYKDILILGYNDAGDLEVMGTSGMASKSELLFLVETFKTALMNGLYDD